MSLSQRTCVESKRIGLGAVHAGPDFIRHTAYGSLSVIVPLSAINRGPFRRSRMQVVRGSCGSGSSR